MRCSLSSFCLLLSFYSRQMDRVISLSLSPPVVLFAGEETSFTHRISLELLSVSSTLSLRQTHARLSLRFHVRMFLIRWAEEGERCLRCKKVSFVPLLPRFALRFVPLVPLIRRRDSETASSPGASERERERIFAFPRENEEEG